MASAASASNSKEDGSRPFFVPAGLDFDELPEELQAAIRGLINPAYRQLVLEARDGLEKSVGVTVVHLLWLEILDQLDLAQDLDTALRPPATDQRFKTIERHLRVVNAKSKASHFLLRWQELRRKLGPDLAPPGTLAGTIEPPSGWPDSQRGE